MFFTISVGGGGFAVRITLLLTINGWYPSWNLYGIQYVYDRGLAPTPEIRQLQKDADKEVKVAKRKRNLLSSGFKAAYKHEILADFDPQDFLDCLPDEAKTIALCCVERQPEACHRHLVADLLQNAFGMEVDHLLPENAI